MMRQFIVGETDLDPLPPRDAVQRTGGGRAISERVSILQTTIAQAGHLTNRRLTVASPDASWVISAEQAAELKALQVSGVPFSLTLAEYEVNGTFVGCRFDGEAIFYPTSDPRYVNYDFTLYLGA